MLNVYPITVNEANICAQVTQALTRKYLRPSFPDYLHSLLPSSTDWFTKNLTKAGMWAVFESLERWEQEQPLMEPPLTVSSSHTKHALEDLHKNICVFRHPDHLPDKQNMAQDFVTGIQNIKLTAANAAKLPGNTLAAIYGTTEDTVLYWAHHEKLCLVDGRIAFMGGLDLCYGRWDTNQHSIADAHPGDINRIVFVGQDYNNSRIMDFQDVVHWQNNKLDRTQNSRMGWTDLSISLSGPVVADLREHFIQRWNFIYDEKYQVRKDVRYTKLSSVPAAAMTSGGYDAPPQQQQGSFASPPGQYRSIGEGDEGERGFGDEGADDRGFFQQGQGGLREKLKQRVEAGMQQVGSKYGPQIDQVAGKFDGRFHHHQEGQGTYQSTAPVSGSGVSVQLSRSCAKWSNGCPIEVCKIKLYQSRG
jgi:phospholipase D1/2